MRTPEESGMIMVAERYRIHPDQPLPALDAPGGVRAFNATDERGSPKSLFALVCRRDIAPRSDVLTQFARFNRLPLVTPLRWAVVYWPPEKARRLVIILHQPGGERILPAPDATIDPHARVGPLCVVGAGARIDAHATLVARVTLGRHTRLGEGSILHPGVVLQDACLVGRHSVLHPGVMVGADGFGYIPGPEGFPRKVPHLGNVVIGDHVEIGANTCIDRAKFGATTIHDHAKIDNLVQIGHNCTVGCGAIICGAAALAGSVKIGPGAIIGGMSALAEQSSVGARARLGGGAQLMSNIPDGETYVGQPAGPAKETMANYAAFRRLASTIRELRAALRDQP
jgi:UDP-3-O-[3-hydroxymyristoyl] glucosamine N-acyltransferase LpxD